VEPVRTAITLATLVKTAERRYTHGTTSPSILKMETTQVRFTVAVAVALAAP
jgi:hypothetical protein